MYMYVYVYAYIYYHIHNTIPPTAESSAYKSLPRRE